MINLPLLRNTFLSLFNQTKQLAVYERPGGSPVEVDVALRQPKGKGEMLQGDTSQESMEFWLLKSNLDDAGVDTPPRHGDKLVVADQTYTISSSVLPQFIGQDIIAWRVKVLG